MTNKTILFETVTAAVQAYNTLKAMTDVTWDCNAVIYNRADEELVKWLVRDSYCQSEAKERIYPYPVSVISKSSDTTIYQDQNLQIEQKYLLPADWEFITRTHWQG